MKAENVNITEDEKRLLEFYRSLPSSLPVWLSPSSPRESLEDCLSEALNSTRTDLSWFKACFTTLQQKRDEIVSAASLAVQELTDDELTDLLTHVSADVLKKALALGKKKYSASTGASTFEGEKGQADLQRYETEAGFGTSRSYSPEDILF